MGLGPEKRGKGVYMYVLRWRATVKYKSFIFVYFSFL